MSQFHQFPVKIYYEDTDVTGLVYHPNYFKYFERARSELFGGENLRLMQEQHGISVAVYSANIVFKKGAILGDSLMVQSQISQDSPYRMKFHHTIVRGSTVLVTATVELVCIHHEKVTVMSEWFVETAKPYLI